MSTPQHRSQVTLFDFLTLICFTTPLLTAVWEGAKAGFAGVLIGVGVGLLLGLLWAFAFRRVFRLIIFSANRWGIDDVKSDARGTIAGILILIASIAWIVAGTVLVMTIIHSLTSYFLHLTSYFPVNPQFLAIQALS